jgi:hypothetical protein
MNLNLKSNSKEFDKESQSNLIINDKESVEENEKENILSEFQAELLELKIYQPYLISHSTIIEYEDYYDNPKSQQERYSMLDILE